MNAKRIVAGGLLAGLVLNIGETILNVPILGEEFDAVLARLGAPEMTGATIGLFVLMCFLLGILSVWLYAAVRPRLGPGPGTAIKIGVVVWLLAVAWPGVGMMAIGLFPMRLMVITMVWEIVEIPLAVLAGAWLYKEEPAETATPQYA